MPSQTKIQPHTKIVQAHHMNAKQDKRTEQQNSWDIMRTSALSLNNSVRVCVCVISSSETNLRSLHMYWWKFSRQIEDKMGKARCAQVPRAPATVNIIT
jgi:hypothetical protein